MSRSPVPSIRDRSDSTRSWDRTPLDSNFKSIVDAGLTFETYCNQSQFSDTQRRLLNARYSNLRSFRLAEFVAIKDPQLSELIQLAEEYDQHVATLDNTKEKAKALKKLLKANKRLKKSFKSQLQSYLAYEALYLSTHADFTKQRATFEETKKASDRLTIKKGSIAENILIIEADFEALKTTLDEEHRHSLALLEKLKNGEEIKQLSAHLNNWETKFTNREFGPEEIEAHQVAVLGLINLIDIDSETKQTLQRFTIAHMLAMKIALRHLEIAKSMTEESREMLNLAQKATFDFLRHEIPFHNLLCQLKNTINDPQIKQLVCQLVNVFDDHVYVSVRDGKYTLEGALGPEFILRELNKQHLDRFIASRYPRLINLTGGTLSIDRLIGAIQNRFNLTEHYLTNTQRLLYAFKSNRNQFLGDGYEGHQTFLNELIEVSQGQLKEKTSALKTKLASLHERRQAVADLPRDANRARLGQIWDQLAATVDNTFLPQLVNTHGKAACALDRQHALSAHYQMLLKLSESDSNHNFGPELAALKLYHNLITYEARHKAKSRFDRWLAKKQFSAAADLRTSVQAYLSGSRKVGDLGEAIKACQKRTKPSWIQRLFFKTNRLYNDVLSSSRIKPIIDETNENTTSHSSLFIEKINMHFTGDASTEGVRRFKTRKKGVAIDWSGITFTMGDIEILKRRHVSALELAKAGVYNHLVTLSDVDTQTAYFDYLANCLIEDLDKSKTAQAVFAQYYEALKTTGSINRKVLQKLRSIPAEKLLESPKVRATLNSKHGHYALAFMRLEKEDFSAIKAHVPTLQTLYKSGILRSISQRIGRIDQSTHTGQAFVDLFKHYIIKSCLTSQHAMLKETLDTIKAEESNKARDQKISLHCKISLFDLTDGGGKALLESDDLLTEDTLEYIALPPSPTYFDDATTQQLGKAGILAHWCNLQSSNASLQTKLIDFAKSTTLDAASFQRRIEKLENRNLASRLLGLYWQAYIARTRTLSDLVERTAYMLEFELTQPHETGNSLSERASTLLLAELPIDDTDIDHNSPLHQTLCRLGDLKTALSKDERLYIALNDDAQDRLAALRKHYLTQQLEQNNWRLISIDRPGVTMLHTGLDINTRTVQSFVKLTLRQLLTQSPIDFEKLNATIDMLSKHQTIILPTRGYSLNELCLGMLHESQLTDTGERVLTQFLENEQFELLYNLSATPLINKLLEKYISNDQLDKIYELLNKIVTIRHTKISRALLKAFHDNGTTSSAINKLLLDGSYAHIQSLLELLEIFKEETPQSRDVPMQADDGSLVTVRILRKHTDPYKYHRALRKVLSHQCKRHEPSHAVLATPDKLIAFIQFSIFLKGTISRYKTPHTTMAATLESWAMSNNSDSLYQVIRFILSIEDESQQCELMKVVLGPAIIQVLLDQNNYALLFSLLEHTLKITNANTQNNVLDFILESLDLKGVTQHILSERKYDIVRQLLIKIDDQDLRKKIKFPDGVLPLTRTTIKQTIMQACTQHVSATITTVKEQAPQYIRFVATEIRHKLLPPPINMTVGSSNYVVDHYGEMVEALVRCHVDQDQTKTSFEIEKDFFTSLIDKEATLLRSLHKTNFDEIEKHLSSPRWLAIRYAHPEKAEAHEETIKRAIDACLSSLQKSSDLDGTIDYYEKLISTLTINTNVHSIVRRTCADLVSTLKETHAALSNTKALFMAVTKRFSIHLDSPSASPKDITTDEEQLLTLFENRSTTFTIPNLEKRGPTAVKFFDSLKEMLAKIDHDPLSIRVKAILTLTPNTPSLDRLDEGSTASVNLNGMTRRGASSPSFFTVKADIDLEKIPLIRLHLDDIVESIKAYPQFKVKGCESNYIYTRFDHPDAKHFLEQLMEGSQEQVAAGYREAETQQEKTLALPRDAADIASQLGSTPALSATKKVKFLEALNLVRNIKIISQQLHDRAIPVSQAAQQMLALLHLHQAYIPISREGKYTSIISERIRKLIDFCAENNIKLEPSPENYKRHIQPILDRAVPSELERKGKSKALREPSMLLEDAKAKVRKALIKNQVGNLSGNTARFLRQEELARRGQSDTMVASRLEATA